MSRVSKSCLGSAIEGAHPRPGEGVVTLWPLFWLGAADPHQQVEA